MNNDPRMNNRFLVVRQPCERDGLAIRRGYDRQRLDAYLPRVPQHVIQE